MNRNKVSRMFEKAKQYCEENYPDELEWANGINENTFINLRSKQFLTHYCWVIYATGFKVSIVEEKFPKLEEAFKGFDLQKLSRIRSIEPALDVIRNARKAESFVKGSKAIAEEGFSAFKKRLKKEGVDMLEQLPGIGPTTKFHLAKNIGLADEPKPDRWLKRAAEANDTDVNELVEFLSKKYSMSRHAVDVVLWRHGTDNGLGI